MEMNFNDEKFKQKLMSLLDDHDVSTKIRESITQPEVGVYYANQDSEKRGLPIYKYDGDAGFDLHINLPEEDREHGRVIHPGTREMLDTGIHLVIPAGYWVNLTHRSSTEKRLRLRVISGTIDTGYVGKLFCAVSNDNSYPIVVHHNDRISQAIIHLGVKGKFKRVDELPMTDRNDKGFGSTGYGKQQFQR